MRTALVLMKALSFFTTNSPTTGVILHGDPREQADELARYPQVSEDDADYLENAGLAERHNGRVSRGRVVTDETVGERGARLMEEDGEADNSVEQPTGLDTRNTTAFERPPHELAGSGGARQGMVLEDNSGGLGSDEAPAGGGGSKPLKEMTKADLEKAAEEEGVDLSSAKNNEDRAALIQKARDSKQQ